MKKCKSYVYQNCYTPLVFVYSQQSKENRKIPFYRFSLLDELKKRLVNQDLAWQSITVQSRKWSCMCPNQDLARQEQQFKVENGVKCGKDSLTFDHVTSQNSWCTTQPHSWFCDLLRPISLRKGPYFQLGKKDQSGMWLMDKMLSGIVQVVRSLCYYYPPLSTSWKGCEFKSWQERQENFLLHSELCVLTLIWCPVHPRVPTPARKRPRLFCQKCRWQVTPKHAYNCDPMKSEWAD